jgi:hypothetical protein
MSIVQRKLFATLTDIRQTGIKREWDGTTTYSFLAQVVKDGPSVIITLTVKPPLVLQVQAHLDSTLNPMLQEDDAG